MNTFAKSFAFLLILISVSVYAQVGQIDPAAYGYYKDALRFSQLYFKGGTARYLALGGAGIALGADPATASVNPAGLGLYRKSEFSFSPNFGFLNTESDYTGNRMKDNRSSFSFSNLSAVFCGAVDDFVEKDWRGGTFSINFSRTNNFNNQFSYSGVNRNNSMADYFLQLTENTYFTTDGLDEQNPDGQTGILDLQGLAYWTWLTNAYIDNNGKTRYYTFIQDETVLQEETVVNTGAQYEWNFAFGGNYKDKIYVGASVNVPTIRYTNERTYSEKVGAIVLGSFREKPDTLVSFTYTDYLKVTGTGINVKFGFLMKATEAFRLGLTLQSPTYYAMRDNYKSGLTTLFDGTPVPLIGGGTYVLESFSEETISGDFRYSFIAPMRAGIGASLFSGKAGFVSGEIEYIPYGFSTFSAKSAGSSAFTADNKTIKNIYKSGLAYRMGGEIRFDIFRLRAGGSYQPDPTVISDGVNRSLLQICAGGGIKLDEMYFDIALVNSRVKTLFIPYILKDASEPKINIKHSAINFVITAGFNF
ncbi:MAG: hypothetical protein NZ529_10005 [Cytophagaceae bacterium]|nr:hypothetical protein [Cytophagaceae bacterium]MDW8457117.1 hypothetical protein [Cytophagaceae bacterium]